MKNIIKSVATILIALISNALLAQTTNFSLLGKVNKLPATAKAYLVYTDAKGMHIDSTLIKDGRFNFADTIRQRPQNATIVISKNGTGIYTFPRNYLQLFLDSATITLSSPDSLENANITAGKVNADNQRLKIALAPVIAEMNVLRNNYINDSRAKSQPKDFKEVFNKANDSLHRVEGKINLNFVKSNPNSMVSLYALQAYAGPIPDVHEIEPFFNQLSESVKSSDIGIGYADLIKKIKSTTVGAVAPDFTQSDTLGNAVSLHNFKGKYVLVDFWASWCVPCRKENPDLLKAFNEFKDKGFTVIGVSLDQPGKKDSWMKAIHADHLTWTQVSDLKFWKNEVAQLYAVKAIPQNFLISPDGKIVAVNLKGDDLINKLTDLLNTK